MSAWVGLAWLGWIYLRTIILLEHLAVLITNQERKLLLERASLAYNCVIETLKNKLAILRKYWFRLFFRTISLTSPPVPLPTFLLNWTIIRKLYGLLNFWLTIFFSGGMCNCLLCHERWMLMIETAGRLTTRSYLSFKENMLSFFSTYSKN